MSPSSSPRLHITESNLDDTEPALISPCDEDLDHCKENEHDSGHESTSENQKEEALQSAFRPHLSAQSLLQQQFYALLASQLNPQTLGSLTAVQNQVEQENDHRRVSRLRTESPASTISDSPRKGDVLDYAERRRRNNDSARRSREVRRQREHENRLKTEVLERENAQLRTQINMLRLELSQLTLMIMQKGGKPV